MTEVPVRSADLLQVDFRALMAGFPTGVAVLTAFDRDGRPWGMTCSSLCSVALDPPTLLVCVRAGSPTLRAITDRGRFVVNLLRHDARPAAELFASGAADRFDRVPWVAGPGDHGPHLAADAHASADCRTGDTRAVGDHVVVFGEVVRVTHRHGGDPRPLLYGLRRFGSWPPAEG